MERTVDACHWRGVQVYQQVFEVDFLGLQEIGQRVVALALHMQLHGGQQPFDSRLVNHLVFVLGYDRVTKGGQLFQYPFVAALCIEFHDEIATLYAGIGGVAIRL